MFGSLRSNKSCLRTPLGRTSTGGGIFRAVCTRSAFVGASLATTAVGKRNAQSMATICAAFLPSLIASLQTTSFQGPDGKPPCTTRRVASYADSANAGSSKLDWQPRQPVARAHLIGCSCCESDRTTGVAPQIFEQKLEGRWGNLQASPNRRWTSVTSRRSRSSLTT